MPHKDPVKRLEWQRRHRQKPEVRERLRRATEQRRARRQTEEGRAYYYGYNIRRLYCLAFEDYQRMLESQNGCCAICGKHESKLTKRLCVDHCHATGEVRGLLCIHCNHAIGKFEDRVDILRNAINYLLRQPGGSESDNPIPPLKMVA